MSGIEGVIVDFPKVSASVPKNKGVNGNVGAKTINIGEDGATFIPSVSEDGIISWTNDKELPNPEPVNIKGVKGDKGDRGDKGEQGERGADGANGTDGMDGADGYTPQKYIDYFTPDDKAEMVSAVIAALPVYNGEVVAV